MTILKFKICVVGIIIISLIYIAYLRIQMNFRFRKSDKPPVILFYELHRERWFHPFNLSGVCPDYCVFTENKSFYNESQAVIFFRTLKVPPPIKIVNQKWIYLTFEPPIKQHNTRKPWIEQLESFDWLMSYERNADLYVPFGRLQKVLTVQTSGLNYSLIYSRKDREVALVVSHCHTHSQRETYVKELQKYINVDIYGGCGDKKCPANSGWGPAHLNSFTDCKTNLSKRYKFYLSFEQALCEDYTSEKLYGIFESNNLMIPVVRGDPKISKVLPTGTYISTFDYKSIKELADHLKLVGSTEEMYTAYLKKKLQYQLTRWQDSFALGICELCSKLTGSHENAQWHHVFNLHRRLTEDMCYKPSDIK